MGLLSYYKPVIREILTFNISSIFHSIFRSIFWALVYGPLAFWLILCINYSSYFASSINLLYISGICQYFRFETVPVSICNIFGKFW